MRKVGTLLGLTLVALATPARAEEAANAAAATPTAGDTSTAALAPPPVATPPVIPAPPPSATAVAVPPAGPPPSSPTRRFEVGLAFLPMGLGRYSNSPNPVSTVTTDAAFAYGAGLSLGYQVIPHLVIGIAPQAIFNVKEKDPSVVVSAARQYDLLARVAGVIEIVEGTTVYAEVLPGYSVITTDASPKGFVVAFGVGAAMQMTDRYFVNIGAGYQIGFQKWAEDVNTYTTSTRYLRVTLGGGVRF